MFVATLVNSFVGMNGLKVPSLMEWPSSSVGTSARLKIVRSTVRSCPEPLLFL